VLEKPVPRPCKLGWPIPPARSCLIACVWSDPVGLSLWTRPRAYFRLAGRTKQYVGRFELPVNDARIISGLTAEANRSVNRAASRPEARLFANRKQQTAAFFDQFMGGSTAGPHDRRLIPRHDVGVSQRPMPALSNESLPLCAAVA